MFIAIISIFERSSKESQQIDDLSDGKHTQTESLSSNDAAVNTGKFFFLSTNTALGQAQIHYLDISNLFSKTIQIEKHG